jgi:hypothetical protein
MKVWLYAAALPLLAFDVDERETIEHSFAAAEELEIDGMNGSIEVTGQPGGAIEVVIERTIRADSDQKMAEAKRDVRLDVSAGSRLARLYVDGPWRCKDGEVNYRGRRYYGYEVRHDFRVRVPANTKLRLKTVNHGDIRIERTAGDFDVRNINGSIHMTEVEGSGHVYALNGKVQVVFRANPRSASSFGSLNGAVDVSFQPALSADLRLKTFNGSVYTDFDVTSLPPTASVAERRDGKFIYRSDRFYGVRAGAGGPELKFDAFNGNIYIRSRSD